jgi:iron complex outermembrane recepter protein
MSNSRGRDLFKVNAVTAGCLVALLAGGAVQAQSQLDTVVVTGIRKGIQDAISVKKNKDNIVESVSAEDIGKLPDISIAESIARLPGLSAQRVGGRAQVISVRGLSPDFSTSLLNGHEIVSTGDNRSVEFDQYPSELLASVLVYKTPDAGLVGQGLSGTIDMQTVRPLNFTKSTVALNARGQRNSLGSAAGASGSGNRLSASYIGQFADRTVGLVLAYAHQQTPKQEEQVGLYEPWELLQDGWRPGVPGGTYYSNGIKALRRTGETKRDAMVVTAEFRPSKAFTSVLDLYRTKATEEDTANQFEVNLSGYNGGFSPGLSVSSPVINGNKSFIGGSASGLYPLVRGMYNIRKDTIDVVGWGNTLRASGATFKADVSYSKADRKETNLENNTQLPPAGAIAPLDTLQLNFATGGFPTFKPGRSYSDPSQLQLRGTIYGSGYGKVPSVLDELKAVRLGVSFDAPDGISSVISKFDIGVNYADRSKKKRQPEGPIEVGAQGNTAIASDLQYSPVDLSFAGVGTIPAWNVPAAVARYMRFAPSETSAAYLIPKAWNVFEKTTTAYLRGDIDTDMGGVGVRGNVGVQVVRVDQSSTSNYWDNNAPAGANIKPYSDGKVRTDVLPSLNLAFSLSDDQTVRVALARQMARPRVDHLRSGVEFGVDSATGKPGASGGNPRLDPWIANAFDVSYEKYFGTKGYVSAAAFVKDLKSYNYTQSRDGYDLSTFVASYVPPNTCTTPAGPNQPCPPALRTGTFTAPFDGKGGKLKGLEFATSLPLELVSSALSGFGISASASFTSSNIKIRDPESSSSVGGGDITLPGLSKQVYSLTAFYEAHGFEARISQRRRSDFIGEIGNFNGARTLRYVVGENITDLQLGYKFSGGALDGLGLLLQVNNLTDSAYQTYAGTKDRPLEYLKWGRSYLLGANYKF